jgi:hypothetical protein
MALLVVAAIVVARGGGHAPGRTRTSAAAPARAQAPTTAPTTTTTIPPPAAPVPLSALPPADVGQLPQTTAEPSASTEAFAAQMQVLWQAVRDDDPAEAAPAFFPEAAYLQVKALSDDAYDYQHRLVANFDLDVGAAHALLGAGAAAARYVEVVVPAGRAQWIRPGTCYNSLGYWHVPGSRLVYEEDGQVRSFGIRSLISWRGYWYVVHFGAVYPPAGQGVVDAPSAGIGSFGPPGGC